MKPLLGFFTFGLTALAIGWVWASEEQELRAQAERAQLEAQKADQENAVQLQKETQKLADQVRKNEQERAEKLRAMSEEDRQKHAVAIHDQVTNLEKMRDTLKSRLGEDHPQIEAIARELDVLRDELRAIAGPLKKQDQEAAQKIDHLRAAAEHLMQAGMPELAQEVRKRAEDLAREHQAGNAPHAEAVKQLQEQMRDVQTALSKLHEELASLREQLQNKKE
jgi:DNA repair exonuclease SbcCD ATPase subunit